VVVFSSIVGYNQLTFFFKRTEERRFFNRPAGRFSHFFSRKEKEMSGSFRARGSLQEYGGNSHRQKEGATLIGCLQKAVVLFNDSASDIFYTRCVCQKICGISRQITDTYGDEIPTVMVNSQTPEKLIEAVKSRIASDGTIYLAVRAEIIEGLDAVLAMING